MTRRVLMSALAVLSLAACAPHMGTVSREPAPSPAATASPSPSPSSVTSPASSAIASPSPAAPAPRPTTMPVAFSGLPVGTYPVHLHSVCSGTQQFHVTVLQSLVVTAGAGTIEVPSGYFGHGLCVIVYSSPALTRVLTSRPI